MFPYSTRCYRGKLFFQSNISITFKKVSSYGIKYNRHYSTQLKEAAFLTEDEQRTDGWFKDRYGRITASNIHLILSKKHVKKNSTEPIPWTKSALRYDFFFY